MDMKKTLFGVGLSAMLATTNVSADFISGDMQLRDAMYIYGQSVDVRGSKLLAGYNCDVFQLVMDVTSGYVDLTMFQGNTTNEVNASALDYPDRIYDSAAMFSYALYLNKTTKASTTAAVARDHMSLYFPSTVAPVSALIGSTPWV